VTDLAAAKALSIRGAFFDFVDDMVGNFAPGKEADFVALDWTAGPPALAWRQSLIADERRPRTIERAADLLFGVMIVGDERAVAETWVMGKPLYRKGSPA
jgi:guanine deaminase